MREETFSIYCAVYRRSSTYEKKKIEEEKSPCLLYFSTKNLLVYFSIDKKQDARMLIFFPLLFLLYTVVKVVFLSPSWPWFYSFSQPTRRRPQRWHVDKCIYGAHVSREHVFDNFDLWLISANMGQYIHGWSKGRVDKQRWRLLPCWSDEEHQRATYCKIYACQTVLRRGDGDESRRSSGVAMGREMRFIGIPRCSFRVNYAVMEP
jgi:hypothetical protein